MAADEAQRCLQAIAELVLGKPLGACRAHRRERCGAQQSDKQEVVEVAGLQRGVLAIVGEAEQLAAFGGNDAPLVFIQRSALDTSRVVAELRPSADRLASLLISRACTGG